MPSSLEQLLQARLLSRLLGWSFCSVLRLSFGLLHDSLELEAAIGVEGHLSLWIEGVLHTSTGSREKASEISSKTKDEGSMSV